MGKRLIVIVGAGISVPAPTKAPDFAQLRDRFLKIASAEVDADRFALDELSPEQVFDAIDDGTEELRRAVRRELWWLCEPNEPNANHYAVASLVEGGITVWTPNFDTMIERAAERLGNQLRVSVAPDGPIPCTEPCLYKAHGSFPYRGDPPREPALHDYRLLFQASDVWLMEEGWATQLIADVREAEVEIFGYRGADPDLTPVMLQAFASADSVTWWEFPRFRNFARLQALLADAPRVTVKPGDPSAALQALAARLAPHRNLPPRRATLSPPALTLELSDLSKARLQGRVGNAKAARKLLWRAVFFDRRNRTLAAFRLVRSLGYDIPAWRVPLIAAAGVALHFPTLRRRARLSEFYATMIDARNIRARDRQALRRLLQIPGSDRAEILVRVASKEKLLGDLEAAARHGERALEDARQRRKPALEAMAAYNLAWTYRQQGRLDERRAFAVSYRDRLPHIGFNWAAWLSLDDVLVALHLRDVVVAREILDGPFVSYARLLVKHPRFRLDDALASALVAWHEHGPTGIDRDLELILAQDPLPRVGPPPFTALDTLIRLADHARASEDLAAMARHLRRAERRAQSELQLAEIELVRVVAAANANGLRRFADVAAARGFGLIAATAEAAHAHTLGRSAPLGFRPDLPLAGTY